MALHEQELVITSSSKYFGGLKHVEIRQTGVEQGDPMLHTVF